MKKIYNAPEAIEVVLNAQDVITSSIIVSSDPGDGIVADWDQA